MISHLSHLDDQGKARMVDVTLKDPTLREATASGKVSMNKETAAMINQKGLPKGDVLSTARIAGIMAAKKTPELIPLCHPLELTDIDLRFSVDAKHGLVDIEATVRSLSRTGVEMEALTAVSAAALTIYDMCKSADREMVLSDIKLISKKGGKSGPFIRKNI